MGPANTAFPGGLRQLYTFFQPSGGLPGEEPQKTVDFREKPEIWYAMVRKCACQKILHSLIGQS